MPWTCTQRWRRLREPNCRIPGRIRWTVNRSPVCLRGSQTELKRKAIYWHFPGYMDNRAVPITSIIKDIGPDRYKLLYFYEPRRYELYKLSADIGEKNGPAGGRSGLGRHGGCDRSSQ